MPSRIALPLRLVQCGWGTAGSSANNTQVLTPYKPCGLPCYAASQVSAVASVAKVDWSSPSSGGDGRRLFAIHTRHAAATNATSSVEASAQPRPEDPSDSLLTRVIDSSLPGCRPYVALPVISLLLRRGGLHPTPAALLNQWTSRHKGLVVVTHTPSDALFLRNAAHLDLVQQTYRVVCHLPAGVASTVRRYLYVNHLGRGVTGNGKAQNARTALLLNPYLRAHAERRREALRTADLSYGIPLTEVATAATQGGGMANFAGSGQLPTGVRPHPLVSGGFFDVARGLLRIQGTVKCILRVQTPLDHVSQHKVDQFARLQNLFSAPPQQMGGSARPSFSTAGNKSEIAAVPLHPWLKHEWRIGVSLDLPNMQCAVISRASGDATHDHQRGPVPAPRGKSLSFDFRLISVSTPTEGDTALYEVHTHGDVTTDEVAAVFQAEGLPVLNDYVQDVSLANVVEEVAQRMRAAPPDVLASLPIGIQHYLRSATAEELVALPLTQIPLEDADRLCIQHVVENSPLTSSSVLLPHRPSLGLLTDDLKRMQHYVQSLSGGSGTRNPLQNLLWHALGTFHLSNAEEKRAYARVLGLTLGSGIECTGLTFPDPSVPSTVRAMQHMWLTYEKQRQKYASLAEAARAARQHPLAAEMHYVRRNVLNDATGLARVPLLEDVLQMGKRGGPSRSAPRGECSFSQGVALAAPLDSVEEPSRLPTPSTATAAVAADGRGCGTAVWSQTNVPPSYAVAYNSWAASFLAATNHETGLRLSETAVSLVSPLWPSPAEFQRRTQQRMSALHHENHTGKDALSSSAHRIAEKYSLENGSSTVRVLLRAEEMAELSCAHCGTQGHTWQHCLVRTADAVAALEETATSIGNNDNNATMFSLPESVDSSQLATPIAKPCVTSVMEDEGLTTVEDAAAVLADQATALAHRRMQRSLALAGDADGDTSVSTKVVPMPNVAATQRFKADYVLRKETSKPRIHRRKLRCVYCSGYHHVMACPRLQAQDAEYAKEEELNVYMSTASATSGMSSTKLPLLCIKCGEKGHLYMDCPQVPGGLHPATHCPICRQPRNSGSHDPLHCPQRVAVPAGYSLSGIPRGRSPSSSGSDARVERSGHGPRGSRSDYKIGERCSYKEVATSGFARPRRRRGSVLIADSYIDSPARGP